MSNIDPFLKKACLNLKNVPDKNAWVGSGVSKAYTIDIYNIGCCIYIDYYTYICIYILVYPIRINIFPLGISLFPIG